MRLPGAAARRRWLQLRIPLAEPGSLRAGGLVAMATALARLGMAAVLNCDGYRSALARRAPDPADGAPAPAPRPGNAVAVRAQVPGLSPLHCPVAG
ncbi:hypothetical protein [Poseidonocella sp. HB161398]|uniref:hypothetical protein n=1 Tax=Poseidonocella sp. HB161398 TaxID=2320855 RepID=UPI0011082A1E|nr:hypothetical protein [Poseidonocella sp. HB161398]